MAANAKCAQRTGCILITVASVLGVGGHVATVNDKTLCCILWDS